MVFLKIDSETNMVNYFHMKPFDSRHGLGKTEIELLQEGFLIDSIPEPEQIEGKSVKMFYTEADGFWFEYEDIPPTPEELRQKEIDGLKAELLNNQLAMAELVELQQPDNLANQLALAELIEVVLGGGETV